MTQNSLVIYSMTIYDIEPGTVLVYESGRTFLFVFVVSIIPSPRYVNEVIVTTFNCYSSKGHASILHYRHDVNDPWHPTTVLHPVH